MFNITELFTWVDASYSVHPKVLSQKGRVTPMSYGMIHCLSSMQNMNNKICLGMNLYELVIMLVSMYG